ncbi:hypothetical protein GVAV_001310 [Gurleya vavrai]
MNAKLDDLKNLTEEILKNPNEISSKQFIDIYNKVYTVCTVVTRDYEIKGRDVYNLLTDILHDYTFKLKNFNSLNELYETLDIFNKNIKILKMTYNYIERYFIKVSLDKRDGYVLDIKTLAHTLIFRNLISKNINKINDIFICEINSVNNANDLNIEILRKSFYYYREILDRNDESEKIHNFISFYVDNIAENINFEDEIKKVCRELQKKIKISNHIFEPFYMVVIKKNLIGKLSFRKEELIDFLIECIENKTNEIFYYKCIATLSCQNLCYKKLNEFVKKKLKTINDFDNKIEKIIDFFIFINNEMKNTFYIEKAKKIIVADNFSAICLSNHSDDLLKIIDECLREKNKAKMYHVALLINYMSYSIETDSKLIEMAKMRLIYKKSDISDEAVFIRILDQTKYFNSFNEINRCIKDIEKNKNTIKITFKDDINDYNMKILKKNSVLEDIDKNINCIDIDYLNLTTGFWNFSIETKKIDNYIIGKLEEYTLKHLIEKHPERKFKIQHRMSSIEIQINNHNFIISYDMYIILDCVEKYEKIAKDDIMQILNLKNDIEFKYFNPK